MNCEKILELAYEDDYGILGHAQIRLHTLFCEECAQKIDLYNSARNIMRKDFFPSASASNIENSVMSKIAAEDSAEQTYSIYGLFSTRGWVIAGLVILISFASAFFGMDFQKIADEIGTSFILPIGIIFGVVLTCYCALFIGSHLKELSEKFGL